jgi:hypothetical protein
MAERVGTEILRARRKGGPTAFDLSLPKKDDMSFFDMGPYGRAALPPDYRMCYTLRLEWSDF